MIAKDSDFFCLLRADTSLMLISALLLFLSSADNRTITNNADFIRVYQVLTTFLTTISQF